MNYTAWLRWSVITLLCLTLFTVFIIADGVHFPLNLFFPYITGKNFTFRILVEIAFALYVLLAIREPKYRPRSSIVLWSFGLFVLWMAIATGFSVDPIKSFWSNFERMDGYITQLHMFAFFLMASVVLTAEKWWERFFQLSTFASVLMAIYSLMQAFHLFGIAPSSQSGPRADGFFGNAIYLAVYMLFSVFITLYLAWRERKNTTALTLYGIAILMQVATLWFTQTRGALLGMIGGLVVAAIYIAIFGQGAHWKTIRRWSLYGVGALVVLIIIFFALKPTLSKEPGTIGRIASISLTDRTTIARFTIWEEAWEGFKQSPKTVLLGWGQENFNFVFNKYYDPTMWDQEQWFDRAHNAFIDWTIAGGLPAFLLYVAMFVAAIWTLFKSDLEVPEQAIFIGLLAGYAFNNLTVFDNLASYLYFYLILAFVHALSKARASKWAFFRESWGGDQTVAIAAPVMLVVLVVGIYYFNVPGIVRAQTLIDALTTTTDTGAAKDPSQNLASFEAALKGGPLGYQETVEQLFQFVSDLPQESGVSSSVLQQAYTDAQNAGNALEAERPHDARIELFYGVFLDQFGQYQTALQQMQMALADSPKKQQILFEEADTYLAEGDTADALPPLLQAYQEDPSYQEAALMYAVGLYYNGETAQGDAILNQSYGTVLVDDPSLMQAYFATKQYSRLAGIYELELKQNPDDAQAMIGDAVTTFLVNGNKAAAIAELQKAANTDATYAQEAQAFEAQVASGTISM